MNTVAKDAVELHGLGPALEIKINHRGSTTTLEISDKLGNLDTLVKRHKCPESWGGTGWNPAHWTLHQDRVDNLGRTWNRFDGYFIVDDFGFLVEVPQ